MATRGYRPPADHVDIQLVATANTVAGNLTVTVKPRSKTDSERKQRRSESRRRYDQSPLGRFRYAKNKAKSRGIEWKLTFEEWHGIWVESGKWTKRGTNFSDSYVMMRRGDKGPYAVGNVRIGTHAENVKERNELFFAEKEERPVEWYEQETDDIPPELVDDFDFDDVPF